MDPLYTEKLLSKVEACVVTPDDPQATLRAIYSAVIQDDFARLTPLVNDDVELHISGFIPLNGSWRGREAMIEGTRRNFAMLSHQKPQIEKIMAQGDSVAVFLRESGIIRETGLPYNVKVVQWFTFEGGKLKRADHVVAEVPA